ncbi:MAG: sugar phosphate isomerase/epimerase, partial [Clostridiales bacterium]|nr:sugar phosphate isomerase/epimerase [Clostridiales bacterium]
MTIPYEEIVNTLIKHNWNGYLLSEYEGPKARITGGASEQLRRQHVMLKRLLGE